ncbi:3-carboxyethylcatechol 2,3-dioxygenase [Salinibacterium sp. ZJ77]|uniref:3-carboxyethylcatechol 2,3-dioxygenase n=1 Tax=Salinibacterium sp. ZJ77 TaxID=2708337 RepID=UPI00141E1689|nr:3-carboxyethylcatechol 2,3-dioxygenase [Salinibacterium sp. ZJ77]
MSHSPGFARDDDEQFGDIFRAGLHQVRAAVAEFAPTLVIFFGSDHRRSFTEILPSISVVYSAEGLGDLRSPTGEYDVPLDLAKELTAELIARDFDIAITRRVALDHGFGQTVADVIGPLDSVPIIPIFINCATPPLGRPARAVDLGRAIGEILSTRDERVLFIGSGGLSHNPPTLALVDEGLSEEERRAISAQHREAAKDAIRPDWDEWFLAQLGQEDTAWAEALTQEDLNPAGVGVNEVRTWLAAYAAGAKPLDRVAYEPVREWITGMGIAMSEFAARSN